MQKFIRDWGFDNVGFVTLGFPDPQPNADEAEARFHSAMTHYLRREFLAYISVMERGERNGKIHFHLLAALPYPIHPGFNFAALSLNRVRGTNACNKLKRLWSRLRKRLTAYGFGGFPQVIPLRKNATAAAVYLAGYMTKTLKCRHPEDMGRRLVRCSRNVVRHTSAAFSWHSPAGWAWREKVRLFAFRHGYFDLDELRLWMGASVLHECGKEIALICIPRFSSCKKSKVILGRDMVKISSARKEADGIWVEYKGYTHPVGPFLPYHLRNPQTPRYHDVLRDENPF